MNTTAKVQSAWGNAARWACRAATVVSIIGLAANLVFGIPFAPFVNAAFVVGTAAGAYGYAKGSTSRLPAPQPS